MSSFEGPEKIGMRRIRGYGHGTIGQHNFKLSDSIDSQPVLI